MFRALVMSTVLFFAPAALAQSASLKNGGFEEGWTGWGVGQYADKGIWWNSSSAQSKAEIDSTTSHAGAASLHIINPSARAPHVFGTTVQSVAVEPNKPYRIRFWAKGKELASNGAVGIIADPAWSVRPVALPTGTFDWRKFDGTFTVPTSTAEIRIIAEDKGETWIDDMQILAPTLAVRQMSVNPNPIPRGQVATIRVDYAAPPSGKTVPVSEEVKLIFNNSLLMSFQQQFELRADNVSHEFTLPVPRKAEAGTYQLMLNAESGDSYGAAQVEMEVRTD